MERNGDIKKSKSEILRDGLTNLLSGNNFDSVEEHDVVIEFIKNYGLKLPSYFTHEMPTDVEDGDLTWRKSIEVSIINYAVNTYIGMYGE